MQTLGPAVGDWQGTGLSYSYYFPALRSTSELCYVSAEFTVYFSCLFCLFET